MSAPDITVIIPCSGRVDSLRRVLPHYLESAAVASVLVVWDSETRPVPDLENPRVTVLRNARTPGLPGARNTGLDACETEFFLFGEDDAYPLPTSIEEMRELYRPGRLIGPNLFEQEYEGQSVEQLRQEMRSRDQRAKRWALGWTTDAAPSHRCIERGTTALVLGCLSSLDGTRFCEQLQGPTFHLEDIDFQLQLRRKGIKTFMATRATWIHLFRGESANAGCRSYQNLAQYVFSLIYDDSLVYLRHKSTLEEIGIKSLAAMLGRVTARATLRRLVWFADYRSPRFAALTHWLRRHAPMGYRL